MVLFYLYTDHCDIFISLYSISLVIIKLTVVHTVGLKHDFRKPERDLFHEYLIPVHTAVYSTA